MPITTLRDHVRDVVAIGAEEEVIRAYAPRGITVMKHAQGYLGIGELRNHPEAEFPREAMGLDPLSFLIERAIPVATDRSVPYPAPLRLSDFGPEPFLYGHGPSPQRKVGPWIAPLSPAIPVGPAVAPGVMGQLTSL